MKTKKSNTVPTHKRTPLGDLFAVNQNKLEAEAIKQLELMSEYGELSAEAEFQVVHLEEQKKLIRSKILLRIEKKGGTRNAQLAEAMYRADPEYVEISDKLSEATYRRELMKNVMFTLAHRRDMLDFFNRRQLAMNPMQIGEETQIRIAKRMKKKMNKEVEDNV